MVKLFVVGFPRDMEEIELVEIFTAYGQVHTITIVTDKDTGVSQGYGFITMTDQAGADRAIAAMNNATIDDRQISVRVAEDKRAEARKTFAKPAPRPAPSRQRYEETAQVKKKRPRRPM